MLLVFLSKQSYYIILDERLKKCIPGICDWHLCNNKQTASTFMAKQVGSRGNDSDLFPDDGWFESQSQHQLP
jgi:hypothetical protein